MNRTYIILAAFLGGLAVALGAFGAHGLRNITADEKILHGFETGVEYQVYHALALLALAGLSNKAQLVWINRAAFCFVTGILLFSGSLYLLTFLKIEDSAAIKFIGPVTPLGGLFFIVGWLCLLLAILRHPKSPV
jgi:uncharacterized membrane protein YgdD (TMEM256/DUF423 family)